MCLKISTARDCDRAKGEWGETPSSGFSESAAWAGQSLSEYFFLPSPGVFIPRARKDVVGNGIPGVVNTDEEQQQR
jgi:hypothetical protein